MSGGGGGGVQETADQIQEQKNNVALYNYQAQTYQPYIQKFVNQTKGDASSTVQASNAKGQVNAEVMKGVTEASRNPNLVNAAAVAKSTDLAAGVNTAGQNEAAGKVRQRQLGSMQNIVDIGRGQNTQVQQTQSAIAGQSVNDAIQSKKADLEVQGATENAIGSTVGAAAGVGAAAYMRQPPSAPGSYGVQDLPEPDISMTDPDPLGYKIKKLDTSYDPTLNYAGQ
jgi:hypothetical protein